jgi:RNA polymerase sigma-70 factor, ECF subfamily
VSAIATAGTVNPDQLERYRRELTGYCYRMLGSLQETEDAVQDTMVRAWRGLATFDDRVGLRPWLYRIATNVCFDMLKGRRRRALPAELVPAATGEIGLRNPQPAGMWIQPSPDSMITAVDSDPAELVVSRESVRLAFIAALQHLLPRQRAVLILRDVLRWKAAEVAALLDTSTAAVSSTLRRARVAITAASNDASPAEFSESESDLLARYIDAFERFDVDALVALLREDAILEMPPFDLWLHGRDHVRRWLLASDTWCHGRSIPITANRSPAVAVYKANTRGDALEPFAIHVLDVADGQITAIHAFLDTTLFEPFGLPPDPDGPGTMARGVRPPGHRRSDLDSI